MTRMEFRRDLHKDPEPLRRTPIHYGSHLFKGNMPEPQINPYPLYNSRHLPVLQKSFEWLICRVQSHAKS
jgi:hypothetical protein